MITLLMYKNIYIYKPFNVSIMIDWNIDKAYAKPIDIYLYDYFPLTRVVLHISYNFLHQEILCKDQAISQELLQTFEFF